MHLDDVHFAAINIPESLYKWVVMAMGIKNTPAIHTQRVTVALQPWIGKICHIYLDDIAIWPHTVQDHTENVSAVPQIMLDNQLYLNLKKTDLFALEICFLGHHISA